MFGASHQRTTNQKQNAFTGHAPDFCPCWSSCRPAPHPRRPISRKRSRNDWQLKLAKLQNACADETNKYCSTVTPGEGRLLYCMQAHEDKISAKCAYELGEAAARFQTSEDNLRDAINACKTEITGVCGKTPPGEGRVAACLIANKSTSFEELCGSPSENRSYGGSIADKILRGHHE